MVSQPPASVSSQRVLTIPGELVADFYKQPAFYDAGPQMDRVIRCILENGEYVDRKLAERDSSRKQIIACSLIRYRDEILCLRRSRRNNRPNLRLKCTLMIGGHVDQLDADAEFPPDNCVQRELDEELGLGVREAVRLIGFVVDPLSLSGWLHLGLVYETWVVDHTLEIGRHHDLSEFSLGRSRHIWTQPMDDVIRNSEILDPWSRLYVLSMVKSRGNQSYFDFVWRAEV